MLKLRECIPFSFKNERQEETKRRKTGKKNKSTTGRNLDLNAPSKTANLENMKQMDPKT